MATANAGVGGIDGSIFFELDRAEVFAQVLRGFISLNASLTECWGRVEQYKNPVQKPHQQIYVQSVEVLSSAS
jgi:hypothetical protein